MSILTFFHNFHIFILKAFSSFQNTTFLPIYLFSTENKEIKHPLEEHLI